MDVLDGDTPLHVAVSNGRPDLVEMLLENGADVKAKNNVGDSALHFACMRNRKTGRKDIIWQLLLHGADVNAQNNVNELEDLEEDSDGELVNDDQSVGGDTPLQNAINESSIQTIRTLLNNGADISVQDGYGLNAIHWAVMIEGVETIRERFRLRNNPMLPVNNSRIEKAIQVIQLLLAHGTDVSTKISCLRATTNDEYWAPRNTAEEFAHSDNIKDMLRYALLQAEVHRRNMVESFTMGYHKRLGSDSQVNKLSAAIMQMVMDRV
jgi:ankyrin repeat protein